VPEARKKFFEDYKDVESLWEILSPSAELRDHIQTYKRLASSTPPFVTRTRQRRTSSLTSNTRPSTRRQSTAVQDGLGRFSKVVTFDCRHARVVALGGWPGRRKRYNLLRGLRKEMDTTRSLGCFSKASWIALSDPPGARRAENHGPSRRWMNWLRSLPRRRGPKAGR